MVLDLKEKYKNRIISYRYINPQTNCWEWTGGLYWHGYGKIALERKTKYVHRLSAWIWKNFDLDSNLCVLHHCDNKKCFNPEHLFIGTKQDNMDDKVENAYDAWPDRLYVVDKRGRIVYKGGKGPGGFNPSEMAQKLRKICSS